MADDITAVTRLLQRWQDRDRDALEAITPLVYRELRRIAARGVALTLGEQLASKRDRSRPPHAAEGAVDLHDLADVYGTCPAQLFYGAVQTAYPWMGLWQEGQSSATSETGTKRRQTEGTTWDSPDRPRYQMVGKLSHLARRREKVRCRGTPIRTATRGRKCPVSVHEHRALRIYSRNSKPGFIFETGREAKAPQKRPGQRGLSTCNRLRVRLAFIAACESC